MALAALLRALVSTIADGAEAPGPSPSVELLRAAAWRAARYGMTGTLVDVTGALGGTRPGGLVPAWELVDRLVEYVGAALDAAGDTPVVSAGVSAIRQRGTGAEQQRGAFAAGGVAGAVAAVTLTDDE